MTYECQIAAQPKECMWSQTDGNCPSKSTSLRPFKNTLYETKEKLKSRWWEQRRGRAYQAGWHTPAFHGRGLQQEEPSSPSCEFLNVDLPAMQFHLSRTNTRASDINRHVLRSSQMNSSASWLLWWQYKWGFDNGVEIELAIIYADWQRDQPGHRTREEGSGMTYELVSNPGWLWAATGNQSSPNRAVSREECIGCTEFSSTRKIVLPPNDPAGTILTTIPLLLSTRKTLLKILTQLKKKRCPSSYSEEENCYYLLSIYPDTYWLNAFTRLTDSSTVTQTGCHCGWILHKEAESQKETILCSGSKSS